MRWRMTCHTGPENFIRRKHHFVRNLLKGRQKNLWPETLFRMLDFEEFFEKYFFEGRKNLKLV
jgi:hypothetical protein